MEKHHKFASGKRCDAGDTAKMQKYPYHILFCTQ